MGLFETLNPSFSHRHRVVEHSPAQEKVAAHDICRVDELNRTYIAVPAGNVPPSWVQLTEEERAALIPPTPSLPKGHRTAIGYGFSPENVTIGEYEDD